MAVIDGQRTTYNIAETQKAIELQPRQIQLLQSDKFPITQITRNLNRRSVGESKFSWHEDDIKVRNLVTTAAANNSVTSIDVNDGALVGAGDILYLPDTGERVKVTSVASNSLTVVRGWGSSNPATIASGAPVYVLGVAAVEGAASGAAKSENPVHISNYTQIFRNPVEMSGTRRSSSNMSSPHDWDHQVRKAFIDHYKDIEVSAIAGVRNDGTSSSSEAGRRTTGGLLEFFTENNLDAGGDLTENAFRTWIRLCKRFGNDNHVVFAAPQVLERVEEWSAGKLETTVGENTYGVKVSKFITSFGTVPLVLHNTLGEIHPDMAIAINFDTQTGYRYLDGDGPGGSRDTKWYPDRQPNDLDGRKDEILTECGFAWVEPKKHGVLTGAVS